MNLLDWILDLFRDPVQAANFLDDPDRAVANAGFSNVTAAQVQTVAAAVAPAVAVSGGDPVYALQQAVAESHGIPFVPQETFAAASPDVLSNNDTRILSPETNIDRSVNLDFGDITFGDKTTNVADHGGVVVNGPNAGDVLTNGSVKQGPGSTANTGDIHADSHSPVIVGAGNEVHDNSQAAGGDIIAGNSGTIIKGNDLSGGHGGNAHAGGGIVGGGTATAGGGGGGSININDSSNHSTTTTTTAFGDQNTVTGGADVHGSIDASHHSDNSVHDSHNTSIATVDDHSTHTVDNSIHQGIDAHIF